MKKLVWILGNEDRIGMPFILNYLHSHNSLKKKFQNLKDSYTGASVVSWAVLTGVKMVSSMVCCEDSASENLQQSGNSNFKALTKLLKILKKQGVKKVSLALSNLSASLRLNGC